MKFKKDPQRNKKKKNKQPDKKPRSVAHAFVLDINNIPPDTEYIPLEWHHNITTGETHSVINGNKILAVPDYRVKAFGQMDIQLSQKLFHSKFQIIAGVNNVLNNSYTEYQDLNGNKKFDEAIKVTNQTVSSGYFRSGVDNTTNQTKTQRNFYLTLSYLFK